jgi:hypothetical protein
LTPHCLFLPRQDLFPVDGATLPEARPNPLKKAG